MHIQEHTSLKEFTTMKIGGTARYFAVVTTTRELQEAVNFAKEKGIPTLLLGGGSNILIAGGEINALALKIEIKGVEWKEAPQFSIFNFQFSRSKSVLVIAGAGESWDGLVKEAVERGLWGIENLSGVPGSVGGAPIQNIGAYGTEIKETIEWVEIFDTRTGELKKLSNKECEFEYRDSMFKRPEGKTLIVTRVALRLQKNGTPHLEYKDLRESFKLEVLSSKEEKEKRVKQITLSEVRKAVIEIRSKKFPDLKEFGTAGSFFKNPIIPEAQFYELKKRYPGLPGFSLDAKPARTTEDSVQSGGRSTLNAVKIPLAWVLDNICGFKGFEKGNVKLFEKQPIVLVQNGLATAEEVEVFAKEIIATVKEKTGIEIEWEVAFIGGNKSHPALDAGSSRT